MLLRLQNEYVVLYANMFHFMTLADIMTINLNNDLLKSLFNALPIKAEGGTDVSSFYVNRSLDDAHDPVAEIREYIAWSPALGNTYLFSGLRGSGKTTELNRLISELKNEDSVAAYYCDASTYLNLNDPKLTLPELLMAALAGLSDAVRQEHGKDFLKNSIWDRVKQLLNSNVHIKPKVKSAVMGIEVELEATLQENPDFKKELNQFARSSAQFFDEARLFTEEVVKSIREVTGQQKVVLVVDSLERLSAPTGSEKELYDSLKEVFFNNSAQLQFPSLSVVYSAPPYLHAVLPNVGSGFAHSVSLPNFKVMKRPDATDNTPLKNQSGIDQMIEIVDLRFGDWGQALSKPVLEHLAWMSGGNVRRFFSLIGTTAMKAALGRNSLPLEIADDDSFPIPVQQAISEAAKPLQWLTGSDQEWLKNFMEKSDIPSEKIADLSHDLPSIIRLFDHSLVLDYQNGSVWFQVPPFVSDYVRN